MFSLFHKPDSAFATLGTGEMSCEASNAVAGSGQAGVGISPQPEGAVPQESVAGEAGRESPLPVADGRQALVAEAAPTKSLLPDYRLTAQTSVRPEGGKSEGASLPTEAPGAMGGPTSGANPLLLPLGDARTAHHLKRSDEEDSEEDTPPDDDELGIGAPLPPRGPRRPPKGRQLRVPEEAKRHSFTPQQRLLSEQRQWAARELDLDLAAELSVADHARLDRLAISSVLQELGYLTLQRIGRAERPKRLTREKLARRVAEFRGESPASKSSDAEKPTPPQSPELAPGEPKNSAPLLLAGAPPSVTMLATSGPGVAPPTGPQAVPSARRERTITSWFRRTLAPLLPFWNSAKISR